MTNETISIDCKVICDLMVVYASGEASEETVTFIEAHIAGCPECQEAYEAAKRGEDLLAELEPVTRPIHIDGRKILMRVQRIFFGAITPTEIGNFPLPEGATGREIVYFLPGGGTASVIIIQFADRGSAHDFLSDWQRTFSRDFYSIRLDFSGSRFNDPNGYGDHPLHWRLELPGVWFGQEGQIVRSYDESALSAYNAWQVEEWVTIVEAEGGVAQAIPLSRQIKELVAESYQR